ncbi:unnamed protein product [Rangifer tarandus platyrhynchus]|uniref:Uncharacterized protein n=1 Tax=Rangifer tarandus platyrhynchus TaxID=3082113 RepID=A0AC59ZNQ7_RANTA
MKAKGSWGPLCSFGSAEQSPDRRGLSGARFSGRRHPLLDCGQTAAEELGRALDEKQKGFAVGWNRGGKTTPGHRAAAEGAVCPGEGRLPARGVHSLQPHARGLSAHLGTVATWVICEPM